MSSFEVVDAGQKSIEHLSEFLLASSTREAEFRRQILEAKPGFERDRVRFGQTEELLHTHSPIKAAALLRRFRKRGTWQVPTLIAERDLALLAFGQIPTDPRWARLPARWRDAWHDRDEMFRWLTAREKDAWKKRYEMEVKVVAEMKRVGVKSMTGTDTPVLSLPGFGLHEELELMVKAGFTPMEALQAATRNPAQFLGKVTDLGTVEKGKIADLVLLDANPLADIRNTQKIAAVILGEAYLPRSGLEKMLAEVEAAVGTM